MSRMDATTSAAVPHYSKANNKVVYAVRVCPGRSSSPAPSASAYQEPYTVYRRWDEFVEFSMRLAAAFPGAIEDNNPVSISPPTSSTSVPVTFRRVPRLPRKVVLFATASTHASRRDELDLYVRQLFALPSPVTTSAAVRDFFGVRRNNGLDGLAPPSPVVGSAGGGTFEGLNLAERHAGLGLGAAFASASAAGERALKKKASHDVLGSASMFASSGAGRHFERSPATTTTTTTEEPRAFRPTLLAKRSAPDLRRFAASSFGHDADEEGDDMTSFAVQIQGKKPGAVSASASPASAINSAPSSRPQTPQKERDGYPAQLNWRYPKATAHSSISSNNSGSESAGTPRASARILASPPSVVAGAAPGGRMRQRSYDTQCPVSPSGSSAAASISSSTARSLASDGDSVRSASTVKPVRGESTSWSRISSPLSFMSSDADEPREGRDAYAYPFPLSPAPVTAAAAVAPTSAGAAGKPSGALKHFRSLQDMRAILAPHPHLSALSHAHAHAQQQPTSTNPTFVPSRPAPSPPVAAPPMLRARSDSKVLSHALAQVVEEAAAAPPRDREAYSSNIPLRSTRSARSSSLSNRSTSSGSPAHSPLGTPAPITTAGAGAGFRRPSLASLRKLQMTSYTSSGSSHHASSPSVSSISSVETASSVSLSRSHSSSTGTGAGLGFGLEFGSSCTSSRESLDMSSDRSSILGSPDSSFVSYGADRKGSSYHQHQQQQADHVPGQAHNAGLGFESAHSPTGIINATPWHANNCLPPLPFFPFPSPSPYDQQAMHVPAAPKPVRRPSRTRSRASSLHTPVLETILASPLLDQDGKLGPAPAEPSKASSKAGADGDAAITIKVLTGDSANNNNFLLKLPKSLSLKEVKAKIAAKCESSHIALGGSFDLLLRPAGSSSGSSANTMDGTAFDSVTAGKSSRMFDTKGSTFSCGDVTGAGADTVLLEDEQDWHLAMSLAGKKITLKIV